jgi:hypothetical protein
MRDMVSQSNSSVQGTRRGPLGWIKVAGERLKGWIEARAARDAAAHARTRRFQDGKMGASSVGERTSAPHDAHRLGNDSASIRKIHDVPSIPSLAYPGELCPAMGQAFSKS